MSLSQEVIRAKSKTSDISDLVGTSDYRISFSEITHSYCIGLVDMIDSTKISAGMNEKEWCIYYEIFLNSMAKIISRFHGKVLKNQGDSLLFYFPDTAQENSKYGFKSCLECGLAMIKEHDEIWNKVRREFLPPLNYRVSADYGRVAVMTTNDSSTDLIGPPVNMCNKINGIAKDNGFVVGGDLFQIVRTFEDYRFRQQKGFSIGLKNAYPIFSVERKNVL
jgi:class 3 adenylate cyclase